MSAKTGQVGVEKGQGWDVRILIEGAIVALDENKSSVSDKKDRVKRSLVTDSRIWIQQLGSKGEIWTYIPRSIAIEHLANIVITLAVSSEVEKSICYRVRSSLIHDSQFMGKALPLSKISAIIWQQLVGVIFLPD
jgi:hypothetical protein